MKHYIVYCSPNGSTRHVAEIIAKRLSCLGQSAQTLDLGRKAGRSEMEYQHLAGPKCLWVGSPVYVNHLVPPVERFLQNLERKSSCYAVPFITWGGVNSGVALNEMAEILLNKGQIMLGAAKVISVHSSMWLSNDPLAAGHPNADDDAMVERLVDTVHKKLSLEKIEGLSLDVLDYQPESVKEESRSKSIATAKIHYPIRGVDVERCTQCGECAENCPAEAITLRPYPVFADDCFLCLKCVRECPEGAIPMDMSGSEDRLRAMAKLTDEKPPTRIFV